MPCSGLRVAAVEHAHDLAARACVVRAEGGGARAGGHAVGCRPCNSIGVVGVCRHIREAHRVAHGRCAGCVIQQRDGLCARARVVRAEGGGARAGGHAVCHCPLHRVGIVGILGHIRERKRRAGHIRLTGQTVQEGDDLGTGAGVGGGKGGLGHAGRDLRVTEVGPLHGIVELGVCGDVRERKCRNGRDLINGNLRADGSVFERDLVVLAVVGLARLIGVDHECELVPFLDGVEVRLQVDGVVVVLADLEGDLRAGGGGVIAGAGVAEVHPAARNDLVADVGGVELSVVIVVQAAAHPRAAGGEGLGHIAALRVVGRERRALGRDVDEHGADHERVAVDQIGAVRQGHGHSAVSGRCADVVVVVKGVRLVADIVVVVDGAARAARLRCVIVVGAGGEAHGHAALDDGVGVDIHRVHGAHVGGAGGQRVTPVSAVDALRGVVAVDGGRAGVAGVGHDDALVGRPAVIGVPDGGVDIALRGDGGHVLGAVFHAAQVVAEPAVDNNLLIISCLYYIYHY